MYRYRKVVSQVHEWVASDILQPGDRILSVREMSAKLGYSTVTVYQAYGVLQDEGILESRPRSGFFISHNARTLPEFAATATDFHAPGDEETASAPIELPSWSWRQSEIDGFGSSRISDDLVPYDELYRNLITSLRWEAARHKAVPVHGIDELRDAVARSVGGVSVRGNARDIVITRTTESALNLCLDLAGRKGGKVLVETPMDSTSVNTVINCGIELVEIYSHPRFGVDPDQFQHLVEHNDISACLLSPVNHAPTGVSYPAEVAKRLVEIATRKEVTIIENISDQALIYGLPAYDLSQFDTRNMVIRMGSFAGTFGSRFGLGWVAAPRRYRERLVTNRLEEYGYAGEWATQKVLSDFLGRRSYERHLRRLREHLSARMRKGLSLVFQKFPDSCTVSRPSGGYMCWVRGPKQFNAFEAAKIARASQVSFAPGPLFSVTRAFGNFVALNFSHPWTPERESQLSLIGELLQEAREKE